VARSCGRRLALAVALWWALGGTAANATGPRAAQVPNLPAMPAGSREPAALGPLPSPTLDDPPPRPSPSPAKPTDDPPGTSGDRWMSGAILVAAIVAALLIPPRRLQ
jgi:hypothetical protein